MRALPARLTLPANAGGQGNQSKAGPGKLIGRRFHVDIATLAEDDESAIGIQAAFHSDAEVIHSLIAGIGGAGDGSIAEIGEVGISQAGIFAAIDSRSDGLVEVCADVGIAASAEREEAVALAADKIECRIHGIGEDGVVAARLLNGLRYPGGKTAVVIADFTRNFNAPGKAIAAAAERVEAGIPYLSVGQAGTKVDACCAFDEPLAEGVAATGAGVATWAVEELDCCALSAVVPQRPTRRKNANANLPQLKFIRSPEFFCFSICISFRATNALLRRAMDSGIRVRNSGNMRI